MIPSSLASKVHPATHWPNLRSTWQSLHQQIPNATVFSSAEWLDAWLSTVGRGTPSHFLTAHSGNQPVAICLLTESFVKRGPFRIKTVWYGTAGEPESDSVYVEFVDVLCLPGFETAFADLLVQHLKSLPWDEFVLPRMSPSPALDALARAFHAQTNAVEDLPSRYLTLDEYRDPPTPFQDTLSRKLRQQIRQSFKIYAETGEVALTAATSVEQAHAFLDELAELHELSWKQRGQSRGAFGSALFRDFHHSLIDSTFARDGIQLLRITAGSEIIGLIYNLVSDGIAYFYQSGLAYHPNSRVKPGFVCQILCVNHSRDTGLRRYDFMGGDTPYKRELGKYETTLRTFIFQNNSLRMRAIETLRLSVRRVKQIRNARTQAPASPEAPEAPPAT